MLTSTATRRAKLASGKFDRNDLNHSAQVKCSPDAKVIALREKEWTRVGNYWIFNLEVASNIDDTYVNVIARPHKKFLNWLSLVLALIFDKGHWVTWWHTVPGTNIIIDIWYVGDGHGVTALATELK